MKNSVNIGIIGLGGRGTGMMSVMAKMEDINILAVCDKYPDRVDNAVKILVDGGRPAPMGTVDYKEILNMPGIDSVYIATDWKHHAQMAIYAMEHGKHVAIEVPSAMTLDEIWALINTSEKTRKHCMQLENCVYDFFELTTLNMAQQGVFGEVLHTEGAYIHNLEDFWPYYWNNWRMDYNQNHRGDVYATHGMGPACQLLDIHRGDKMNYLVSMDTKAVNGPAYIKKTTGKEVKDFQNGDQTSTLIRTEKGKTILIQHNVMTPRPYNRMYQLVGTEGYAAKYPVEQWSISKGQAEHIGLIVSDDKAEGDGLMNERDRIDFHGTLPESVVKKLQEMYPTPILDDDLEALAKKVGGHGGMDFLMDYRLNYCLHYGLPLDMDVYDLAEWCCIGELGSISIENGCAPVEVPDFTRGAWNKVDGFKYAFADGSMK